MPLPSLPPELLVAIAEQVDERSDLCRLCLASRAWNQAAQLVLHRAVEYMAPGGRGSQLARTLAARDDLAQAVREAVFGVYVDEQHVSAELQTVFSRTSNITGVTVVWESAVLPILSALVASPLPNLSHLVIYEVLWSADEVRLFSNLLEQCRPLVRLVFEGVHPSIVATPSVQADLLRFKEALKRHSLTSFALGIACKNNDLDLLGPQTYTSLRHLTLEVSVSPEVAHLGRLINVESLKLYTAFSNEFDLRTVDAASIKAKETLGRCQVLPRLRSITLALNWREVYDYLDEPPPYPRGAEEYTLNTDCLSKLPSHLQILKIDCSLVSAGDFLTFLDSTHRPRSLSLVKVDLYSEMRHSSKLKPVIRRLHSLGVRCEIRPFAASFDDPVPDDGLGPTFDELKITGPVLRWDGGEWTEPDIATEGESEATSDEEKDSD